MNYFKALFTKFDPIIYGFEHKEKKEKDNLITNTYSHKTIGGLEMVILADNNVIILHQLNYLGTLIHSGNIKNNLAGKFVMIKTLAFDDWFIDWLLLINVWNFSFIKRILFIKSIKVIKWCLEFVAVVLVIIALLQYLQIISFVITK